MQREGLEAAFRTLSQLAALDAPAGSDAVTAVIAGITGYFVVSSMQPAPVGVPHLRAYQRAQGEAALAWLRSRLGQ